MKNYERVIDVEGEAVGLRFDFNALAKIEELTEQGMGAAQVERLALWALHWAYHDARGEEPPRDLKGVGRLMTPEGYRKLSAAMKELQAAATPETSDDEGNPPEAPTTE